MWYLTFDTSSARTQYLVVDRTKPFYGGGWGWVVGIALRGVVEGTKPFWWGWGGELRGARL